MKEYIKRYHNLSEYEHPGIANTIKIIQKNCHFSNIRKQMMSYIKKYHPYQINKHIMHTKYGQLQIIKAPK